MENRQTLDVVTDALRKYFLGTEESPQLRSTVVSTASVSANRSLIDPLSERELEVLKLMDTGLSNSEIAERLFVGKDTVKKHINHFYSKLSVNSRAEALARAHELGLL